MAYASCTTAPTCQGRGRARPDRQRGAPARSHRHPGQQRRHPAHRADRGLPGREVGRHHRAEPVGRVPRHRRRAAVHEEAGLRPHHQHRLGPRAGGLGLQVGLCRRQARRGRLHQGHRAGNRRPGHHGQRHLPGLGAHPLVEKQITALAEKNGVDQEAAARELLSESSPRCNLSRRNNWAAPPSSWRPTPPRRSPAPPFPSTAAGPRADIR